MMELPKQVIEVKEQLLKAKDHRSEIIKSLTESEKYRSDIEKMWKSLLKAENDNGRGSSNEWILEFLDAIYIFRQEKAYFSLSGADRKIYMKDIRECTRTLKIAYKELGLDQPYLLYDPYVFPLFDDKGNPITETNFLPAIGITEALDFYHDYANEEVRNYKPKGKGGERQKSNRFVRLLGQRFMTVYKKPLLEVTARAALLLYGEEYSQPQVHNLVRGRK